VKLINVIAHVLAETNRHAGHADILREQLDGATGFDPDDTSSSAWGVKVDPDSSAEAVGRT
jgi:hypothetical protein